MKTTKQHKLVQERANLLEKNEQLKAELQVLIDKSNYDNDNYTFSDDEREIIRRALTKANGNRKEAAALLGLSERTIYRKMKEYNL